jgi:asparagine synthetase B (glutamine-hydrolysing)
MCDIFGVYQYSSGKPVSEQLLRGMLAVIRHRGPVEARVLLLDYKLVEFAASLPAHLKLRYLTRKYLFKKVSRGWLPAQILARNKQLGCARCV